MKNGKCYQIGLYALFSPLFRTIYHFLITVVGFLRLLCILTEYYVQFDWLFLRIYRGTGHRRRHYLKRFSNFAPLTLKKKRFRVSCLFSIRDHRRCQNVVRKISDTEDCASCANFLPIPRFQVIIDLLLIRPAATAWNLFLK